MMSTHKTAFLVMLLALSSSGQAADVGETNKQQPPNIIIFLVDDMGLMDTSETIDGQNLTKLLAGQPDPQHRDEFLSHYPHLRGRGKGNDYVTLFRRGKWKIIYNYPDAGNRYELYDLESDPTESNNLAASNPEKLKEMMQAMVRQLESMNALYPVKDAQQLKPVIGELDVLIK